MKGKGIIKTPFCVMIFCLLFSLLFLGCFATGSGRNTVKTNSPDNKSEELQAVDKDINFTKSQIQDYETFRTQQLHQAVINDVENDRSRGWVKLDGQPTYEEIAQRSYANAAAAETEIDRLKNKLSRLESQKSNIMKQSSGCFLPETLVRMEDNSLKSLAQLQPGQKVLTYDIGYEKLVSKPVIKTYSVNANHLYTINNQLTATGGERLLSQDGWKKIRNLKKGDLIHLDGRMVEIENIDYVRADHTLYNIQVADTHNFYVVTSNGSAFLVHNTGGGGGGGGGSK